MIDVFLNPKADRAVHGRHPWVFSRAVAPIEGDVSPGDLVRVHDSKKEFFAFGHISPSSQIRLRLLSWDQDAKIDESWWFERLSQTIALRRNTIPDLESDACRLVFAEADFLPGLIVDWYAGYAVLQALTVGMDRMKTSLTAMLMEILKARGVIERSDTETRRLEGLEPQSGVLAGSAPDGPVEIREGDHRFLVDLFKGQKTGFYLDQRENRKKTALLARGRDVLDCFSYTGGFSVFAAGAGAASICRVDSSVEATDLGRQNLELNGLSATDDEVINGDVFKVLRQFRDQRRQFDLIILDPPKFAPTRSMADKATRAYKDINLLAIKLLKPDGILATFSCSRGIEDHLFQKIIHGAALDAGRPVQVFDRLSQAPDHPVLLSFPESYYLKGLICRVL